MPLEYPKNTTNNKKRVKKKLSSGQHGRRGPKIKFYQTEDKKQMSMKNVTIENCVAFNRSGLRNIL